MTVPEGIRQRFPRAGARTSGDGPNRVAPSLPLRLPGRRARQSGQRRAAHWARILLPALTAGVGLTLSLPPFGIWVLAFPAAGLMWWRLRGLSWGQRLAAGWVLGLGQFVVGLWWALGFNVYGGIVLMIAEAVAPAIACAATPPGRGRTPALVGGMVLVEALRGTWPFGGLPLGGLALGQAGGPFAYAARLGGPLLLVALVWLGGAGIGLLADAAVAFGRQDAARGALAGMSALVVVGALGGWGYMAADGGAPVRTLRVASVQGGGVRGLRKAQVSPTTVFEAQVEATSEIPGVADGRPPAMILWPEDVVSLNEPLQEDPGTRLELASIAARSRATLVAGVTETVSSSQFRNEIVAFSPGGRIVATFEKVHRVPFGEYVPYRGFFEHLANLSAVPLDAIPGHGNGLMRTPAGALGVMVSYEVFFPERGWLSVRAGAQLLIVPTNTSSYSTSQVPTQEIAASRLQALSEGRDLVQAAPTGFSAVIDNDGAVLQRTSLGTRQVLVANVSMRSGRTLYSRLGDLPVLIGAGLLVVSGWALALTSRGDADRQRERSWDRLAKSRR